MWLVLRIGERSRPDNIWIFFRLKWDLRALSRIPISKWWLRSNSNILRVWDSILKSNLIVDLNYLFKSIWWLIELKGIGKFKFLLKLFWFIRSPKKFNWFLSTIKLNLKYNFRYIMSLFCGYLCCYSNSIRKVKKYPKTNKYFKRIRSDWVTDGWFNYWVSWRHWYS